ncbi:MAG: glycyl-radical enzyme activating protein [Melioribacteraceae bacterium]|nr:glycyl-radical enzyme activating protein [Melioribacteraceae bacterium]MCF8355961.1 glycyl-radical enzyme activating protein [Melioribacteraceae bacterium]MCF8395494.1 glycyl-radical enzyme activating protein [Melioribacteraceae bacterium]MCF8420834.1 glycyl-radical enzyme activating protein [Melioribacteraceae bacterium]
MKGRIFDIKKFAIHDGPGLRTTVFFKGCPLNCLWCHNPEAILESKPSSLEEKFSYYSYKYCGEDDIIGSEIESSELLKEILKDRIFYEDSGGGVTFSGGEPFNQTGFLYEVLRKCKSECIHTAVDTSGYTKFENLERVYDLVDLFLYDLKIFDESKHIEYTGVSNRIILDNLSRLSELGNKAIIIRIPLIPGITDTKENLIDISQFLVTLNNINRVDLLPYNRLSESKQERYGQKSGLTNLNVQTEKELIELSTFFSTQNLKVKIRG